MTNESPETEESVAPGFGAVPRAMQFPHGADIGVRGIGPTREVAFEQAAVALAAAVTDPGTVRLDDAIPIQCEASDDRILLADWLNAIIYEMAVHRMVFGRFRVVLNGHRLQGDAWGERVDPLRHAPAVEPKGATYTAIAVKRESDGSWVAECVVDV